MKRFLLISLFFLLSLCGYSQIDTWKEVDKSNLITQKSWTNEEPGQYGSFWWIVRRTPTTSNQGWYGYYINFYSNSYLYNSGVVYKSSSYIENISITMYEYQWIYFPIKGKYDWDLYNTYTWKEEYNIFDWEETPIARFWSKSKYCVFKVTYGNISSYDYSKKQ